MDKNQYAKEVLLKLQVQLPAMEKEKLHQQLIVYINHLLTNDFNKLIQLLYTVDVDEKKLKEYLGKDADTDAAIIISDLLITRQEQKNKTRNLLSPGTDISEEEKW